MVKHLFITFSHKDIGRLTLSDIGNTLLTLDKYGKVVAVKEVHRDGTNIHYHVLFIMKVGLSKNTYRGTIRKLFPEMKGRGLDVSGVRNLKYTVKYMVKDVIHPNDLLLMNMALEDFLKLSENVELAVYLSILGFEGRFDDWKAKTMENRLAYYASAKKVLLIWEDVQKSKIKSFTNLKKMIIETSIDLTTDLGTLTEGIPIIHCVLMIKFCVRLFSPHEWKRTNLLVSGEPNTGKTSFFKKFESVFNCSFYWAPSRIGDLTGFDPKHGLIILDDVISAGNKWPMAMLLKMLGREGFKGDMKIRHMIDIPAGIPVVVITNFPDLFINLTPLSQRLMHIDLVQPFSWFGITDDQFKLTIFMAIDGVKSMTTADIKVWNYCYNVESLTSSQLKAAKQFQLAINSILTERGNKTEEFPTDQK